MTTIQRRSGTSCTFGSWRVYDRGSPSSWTLPVFLSTYIRIDLGLKEWNKKLETLFLRSPKDRIRIGMPRITDKMMEAIVLGGEPLTLYLDKSNPTTLSEYKRRLQSFVTYLDGKYRPPKVENLLKQPKNWIRNPSNLRRTWAAFLMYLSLNESLYLYALQMDGPAVIDAYSVVETFAARYTIKNLDPKRSRPKALIRMVEYASLEDLAEFLHLWGVWNHSDLQVVRRLSKFRNGFVHKNRQLVSRLLYSGKEISPFDIPKLANQVVDTQSIILASLELILKIMVASIRLAPKRRKLEYARISGSQKVLR